MIRLNIKKIIM